MGKFTKKDKLSDGKTGVKPGGAKSNGGSKTGLKDPAKIKPAGKK